jgi:hypothetical protein
MLKWFLTTLFVGLIPFLTRIFVYAFLIDTNPVQWVKVYDIMTCGLVLNISIYNERNSLFNLNSKVSSASSTISLFLIAIFLIMFVCELVNEVQMSFKPDYILYFSCFVLALTSLACVIYMIYCYPFRKKEDNT